jgi:hypothetical protein
MSALPSDSDARLSPLWGQPEHRLSHGRLGPAMADPALGSTHPGLPTPDPVRSVPCQGRNAPGDGFAT